MKKEDVGKQKKSYKAPQLIEHGTVEDLTETDGPGGTDCPGLDSLSGTCDAAW
jgi:hypothetical protein